MPVVPRRAALMASLLALTMLARAGLVAVDAQGAPPECELEPLTVPLFDATPAARIAATPLAVAGAPGVVDEAVIRRAVEIIVDCINTGQTAYQFAIFTERYLAGQFADPSATSQPEFERRIAVESVGEEQTLELVDVSGIELLDDGRVSVAVALSGNGTTYRDTLVLANVDGIWLIDAVEAIDPPR